MARPASLAITLGSALLSIGVALPVAAKPVDPQPRIVDLPGHGMVYVQPVLQTNTRSQARIVNVPGYGKVYVVPVLPNDTRTPKQRCIDEEIGNEGGTPSRLAWGAIDLKCSQH
jgi:hypothetical protein